MCSSQGREVPPLRNYPVEYLGRTPRGLLPDNLVGVLQQGDKASAFLHPHLIRRVTQKGWHLLVDVHLRDNFAALPSVRSDAIDLISDRKTKLPAFPLHERRRQDASFEALLERLFVEVLADEDKLAFPHLAVA